MPTLNLKTKKMKNFIKILILNISFLVILIGCSKDVSNSNFTESGKSGSEARMIIVGDYMYVVDNQNLKTFDISTPSNPIEKNNSEIGFGIETIFPFANYLFIGSTEGMYIYDISNPELPIKLSDSFVPHFTSCDPVVANSSHAYVTLNTLTSACGSDFIVNEMQVINIQNINNPQVILNMPLQGPKGLGLDGNNLFVCDKDLGVLVFDISNPASPQLIDTITGFTANDLIPDNGNLMVVCDDGLRQFDYTDINNISLISYLDIND